MSKHTKGEWYFRNGSVYANADQPGITERKHIAEISHMNEDMTANAKLIASSPDLLQVANALLMENEMRNECGLQPITDTLIQLAKSAIKKATE